MCKLDHPSGTESGSICLKYIPLLVYPLGKVAVNDLAWFLFMHILYIYTISVVQGSTNVMCKMYVLPWPISSYFDYIFF